MNITISSIVVAVIAIALMRFASKLLYKLLGLVVLIGVVAYIMFHFQLGPFKDTPISIAGLEGKYCKEVVDVNKCDCIIKPIKADLRMRWTDAELEEMEGKRTVMAYAIKKSFDASRGKIENCLAKRKAEKELKEFGQEFLPIEKDLLQEIKEMGEKIGEKSKDFLDSMKEKKETVDDRYAD